MKTLLTTVSFFLITGLVLTAFTLSEQTDLKRNKALVKDYLDANYIHLDWEAVEKVTHKDFMQYSFDQLIRDYNGLKARFADRKAGKIVYHDVIAEGNKVSMRYTATLSPKVYNGIDVFTIKDGKVIELRGFFKQMND